MFPDNRIITRLYHLREKIQKKIKPIWSKPLRVTPKKKKTLIFGHRGASFHAPENTLASVKKAFALEADGVEVDIQLTHDKKIIVLHDDTLQRTATYTQKSLKKAGLNKTQFKKIIETPIHLLDYDIIKKINVALWKKKHKAKNNWLDNWSKEQVPTLNKVLDIILYSKKPRKIQVEIKTDDFFIISKLKKILAPYPKQQVSNSIIIIGFNLEIIKLIKKEIPYCKALLVKKRKQIPTPKDVLTCIEKMVNAGLDGISFEADPTFITKKLVTELHRRKKHIGVWAYPKQDTLANLQYFKNIGVDFITTNLPPAIAKTIKAPAHK